jgi:hypothetical protein
MKTKIRIIVATLSLITSVSAFPVKFTITPGDLAPLEALADKFAAFQKAALHGESFYTKSDAELQKKHSETYALISESLTSDRINERQGARFIKELIHLGQVNLSRLENAASLTATDQDAAAKSLADLQEKIKEASVEKVAAEVLTPEINRVQQTMYELCLFTQSDDKLSNKSSSLFRRLESLIDDEQKIKEDNQVSDREREQAMEDLTDTWTQFILIIKR